MKCGKTDKQKTIIRIHPNNVRKIEVPNKLPNVLFPSYSLQNLINAGVICIPINIPIISTLAKAVIKIPKFLGLKKRVYRGIRMNPEKHMAKVPIPYIIVFLPKVLRFICFL